MSSAHLTQLRKWFLHSPPGDWVIRQIRELLIGAIRQGTVPKHVAFVMDGNRRYARTHKIETIEGHHLGFEALARVLEVCYKSGVKVVTIYAFSVENFKRSRYEVDALMELAKLRAQQLSQHGGLLQRFGAKVRLLGQRDLLRPDVLEEMRKAEDMTKDHNDAVLNICFPYTSRNEITSAIRDTVRDFSKPLRPAPKRPFSETRITHSIRSRQLSNVSEGRPKMISSPLARESVISDGDDTEESSYSQSTHELAPSSHTSASTSPNRKSLNELAISYPDAESITAETLTANMYTKEDPPVDILIRTSGVHRLSDFMLWQCHEHTSIIFLDCLWPEFDLWQFLPVLVEWQWKQRKEEETQLLSNSLYRSKES